CGLAWWNSKEGRHSCRPSGRAPAGISSLTALNHQPSTPFLDRRCSKPLFRASETAFSRFAIRRRRAPGLGRGRGRSRFDFGFDGGRRRFRRSGAGGSFGEDAGGLDARQFPTCARDEGLEEEESEDSDEKRRADRLLT